MDGRHALARGQLDAARVAFTEAQALEPTAYAPRLGLADLALREGRLVESEQLAEEAARIAPKSAEVQAVAGRVAFAVRKNEASRRYLQQAIALDPAFVTPRLDLGELHLATGQPQAAAAAFRGALGVQPSHAGALFGLGRALAAQGDAVAALKALAQAERADPGNPVPMLAQAELLGLQKQWLQARAALDRATQADASNSQVRLARADLDAASGAVKEATAGYQALIAEFAPPANAVILVKLGTLQQRSGQPEAALASFRKAVDIEPRLHLAYNNFAWLAADRKTELDRALAWARRALELAPGTAAYEDTLGAVLEARGETAAAVDAYRRAIKAAPRTAAYHHHLGRALQARGDLVGARASYDAALKTGQDFAGRADAQTRLSALGAKLGAKSAP
jgi:tetratricopeptide (TPR) repeat protein